ncbi:MAG: hypothetical protein ACM3VW_10410 [Bacteroidota bacterium]
MRLWLIAMVILTALSAGFAADQPPIIMGDYDAEPRLADGHVDNATLLQRLQEMHANTYFYLIWHAATDWEDLQAFLPMADKAGIKVWAYLCPPSESGGRWPYSEPFKVDYVRWGEEIGKLSLKQPNLVGWVIDDFWSNVRPSVFTNAYVKQFVGAGKAINPKLKFYPLMYYPQITERFTDAMAGVVDGVVGAYPADTAEMERAVSFLSDDRTIAGGCWTVYPAGAPSKAGDFAGLSQIAKVTNPNAATISFHYQDDYDGPTDGYHVMQLRVDNELVWSEDVAGKDEKTVLLDLSQAVGVKPSARITFGVWDLKGVSEYAVQVAFRDLKVTGLDLHNTDLGYQPGWEIESRGAFRMECRPERKPQHAFKLPLIVMPAGSRGEYANRYKDAANAENIGRRTCEALELAKAGKVEGVVMYCLDKAQGNADLAIIGELYKQLDAK